MFYKKMLTKFANKTHGDTLNVSRIKTGDWIYKISFTKRKCNKRDIIDCKGNQITCKRLIPWGRGRSPMSVIDFVYQAPMIIEPNTFCLLVVSGKPNIICGLDEGIFSSIRMLDIHADQNKLYVMSEHEYKKYFIPALKDFTSID